MGVGGGLGQGRGEWGRKGGTKDKASGEEVDVGRTGWMLPEGG